MNPGLMAVGLNTKNLLQNQCHYVSSLLQHKCLPSVDVIGPLPSAVNTPCLGLLIRILFGFLPEISASGTAVFLISNKCLLALMLICYFSDNRLP